MVLEAVCRTVDFQVESLSHVVQVCVDGSLIFIPIIAAALSVPAATQVLTIAEDHYS